MPTAQNEFLSGWLSGRRTLIEKLQALSAEQVLDHLSAEDEKDRRTAARLKIRVEESF